MQTTTDKVLASKTPEFIEHFWTQLEESVGKIDEVLLLRFELDLKGKKGLHQRIFAKVREKMESEAIGYFSQPSFFMYRLLVTHLETSEDVKRGISRNSGDPLYSTEYDAEADIKETRPQVERELQTSFGTELAYWKAMDEERYTDAKVILSAITLMRVDKELIFQIEACNWKMDLACRTGDIELFLQAIASMPDNAACAANADDITRNLKQLLIAYGMHIKVGLPSEVRRRLAPGASMDELLREPAAVFINSFLLQITSGILLNKHMQVNEFLQLVRKATEDSRASFLKVHPYITDLIVVWKKQ